MDKVTSPRHVRDGGIHGPRRGLPHQDWAVLTEVSLMSRAIPRQQNLARRSKCGSKTVLIGGYSAAFRVRCHFYDYRLGASFS
jgi:hypothetical protein